MIPDYGTEMLGGIAENLKTHGESLVENQESRPNEIRDGLLMLGISTCAFSIAIIMEELKEMRTNNQ